MLRAKKVGLLVKIALLILLAYLIITLVNVRQQIGDAQDVYKRQGLPLRTAFWA